MTSTNGNKRKQPSTGSAPKIQKSCTNSGISGVDEALLYQKRWTLYLALLAYKKNRDFVLRFELSDASALDDISLEIGNYIYFLQIKHVSNKRNNITKTKLTEKEGSFSLLKYCGAWETIQNTNNESIKDRNKTVHSILLSNYALSDDCRNCFEPVPESIDWVRFLNGSEKGEILCLKSEHGLVTLEESFVEHFMIMTEQQSNEELENNIGELLHTEFGEKRRTAVALLERELTKLFHKEKKQAIPKNSKWLEGLFLNTHEKLLSDRFESAINSTFQLKSMSDDNDKILLGTVVILPYDEHNDLRLSQAQHMIITKHYWYIEIKEVEYDPLKSIVLRVLEASEAFYSLVLLDNGEDESFSLIIKIVKVFAKEKNNIIIITNRDKTKLEVLESQKTIKNKPLRIKYDTPDVKLDDLKTNENYDLYEITFQGMLLPLIKIPNYTTFKAELYGDSLVQFIKNRKLTVGIKIPSCQHDYQARTFVPIEFEIDYIKLKEDPECDTHIHQTNSEICVSEKPLHIVKQSSDSKGWIWYKSKPNCRDIITSASHVPNLSRNFSLIRTEDSVIKKIDKVYETLASNVKLRSSGDEINENKFVEQLNTTDHAKLTVIGGETGAGKSTTLRNLAELFRQNEPKRLVVFINLCRHELIKKTLENDINDAWIKKFLMTAITDKESGFEQRYFESGISNAVVLIDSFDELYYQHIRKAFIMLEQLIQTDVHRIIICSRQYQEYMLFNQSPDHCKVYHLKPLMFKDQVDMFQKVCTRSGKNVTLEYAEKKLASFQTELKCKDECKLGESLAVHMLAQIIIEDERISVDKLTVFDLFERFLDCFIKKSEKTKVYLNDTNSTPVNNRIKETVKRTKKFLGILCLKAMLSKESYDKVVEENMDDEASKYEFDTFNGLKFPNLEHRAFTDFLFSYSMYEVFSRVRTEAMLDTFYNVFKEKLKRDELVRLFFFKRITKNQRFFDQLREKIKNDKISVPDVRHEVPLP